MTCIIPKTTTTKTWFPTWALRLGIDFTCDPRSCQSQVNQGCAFLSPDRGPLHRTSGNWWAWPSAHRLFHHQQRQDRREDPLCGWGRWLVIRRAENKEHTLAGICVCVCVSFDSPKLLFCFVFSLLCFTPNHRKVQNINYSMFSLHELWSITCLGTLHLKDLSLSSNGAIFKLENFVLSVFFWRTQSLFCWFIHDPQVVWCWKFVWRRWGCEVCYFVFKQKFFAGKGRSDECNL